MTAPDRIFAFDYDIKDADGNWITRKSWSDQSIAPIMASVEYVRADLARAPLAEALAVPEVKALVEALKLLHGNVVHVFPALADLGSVANARAALRAIETGAAE